LIPIDAWHADVEQDEVGLFLARDRHSGAGLGSRQHAVLGAQHGFNQLERVGGVVHHQDGTRLLRN